MAKYLPNAFRWQIFAWHTKVGEIDPSQFNFNFINVLHASFTSEDPKSAKRY